jgi:hypothetical protein
MADILHARRPRMQHPQDIPGRFGRVVRAVDRLLQIVHCEGALAGGWAVWHHGYLGRMTQDLDVVIAADRLDEFLRVASVAGFDLLATQPGRWPKMIHRETNIEVDVLPEGARPGMASRPAPTTIPHPSAVGAEGEQLRYVRLESLIELKLAAGRSRDETDVIELLRARPDRAEAIRAHLQTIHADYVAAFDRLVQKAREQDEA